MNLIKENKRYKISDPYDDYYILHSLESIIRKINLYKNNDLKVLLVSKNSGKAKQLSKGKYKYTEIGDANYSDDILYFLDENKILFFEIGVFLELYNNLKSSINNIYVYINGIINKAKLFYIDNRYKNINDYQNNINKELIIKERELERLKKLLQEYFDINDKTECILPSYRLKKYDEDQKKDIRYYTLESLIVLDEILKIYKEIKTTEFAFIRNISYLDDTEEIASEIFNFDYAIFSYSFSLSSYSIEYREYMEYQEHEIYLKKAINNINNIYQKEIYKFNLNNFFNNLENIKINDLENIIFFLYNKILELFKKEKNNEEYNELKNGILYYDSLFYNLIFLIEYLCFEKNIISIEEFKNIITLYKYKFNPLRKRNSNRFYNFYLNNETAKKYNINNYHVYHYYMYYFYDFIKDNENNKKYLTYHYDLDILNFFHDFILFSAYYSIILHDNYKEFKANNEKKHDRLIITYNFFNNDPNNKACNELNFLNNSLYFLNIINYDDFIKMNDKIFELKENLLIIKKLIDDNMYSNEIKNKDHLININKFKDYINKRSFNKNIIEKFYSIEKKLHKLYYNCPYFIDTFCLLMLEENKYDEKFILEAFEKINNINTIHKIRAICSNFDNFK